MIPSILATAVATAISSSLAGKMKMFQPFMIMAGVLATIGCGLILTLGMKQNLGNIIGFQILYGAGTGIGVQLPNLVATVTSSPEDVSTAIASVACEFA